MSEIETENKVEQKESWIKTKPEQLEKIVRELAEQGKGVAEIGLILRDKHGIPKTKLLGKKIGKILKHLNVKHTTEKDIINKKIDRIKLHLEKNKLLFD